MLLLEPIHFKVSQLKFKAGSLASNRRRILSAYELTWIRVATLADIYHWCGKLHPQGCNCLSQQCLKIPSIAGRKTTAISGFHMVDPLHLLTQCRHSDLALKPYPLSRWCDATWYRPAMMLISYLLLHVKVLICITSTHLPFLEASVPIHSTKYLQFYFKWLYSTLMWHSQNPYCSLSSPFLRCLEASGATFGTSGSIAMLQRLRSAKRSLVGSNLN